MEYQRLPRSWKRHYNFRLACPSFVYPVDYDVNVDLLGDRVDDIELLFFESRPAARPSGALIGRLADLGRLHRVGYNVHWPTDLTLFDADRTRQQDAVAVLAGLTRLLAPLQPAFHILHLETDGDPKPAAGDRRRWEERVMQGVERLAAAGIEMSRLRVENQSVPLEWIEPVLETFNLMFCLDIGHLNLAGEKLEHAFSRWHGRIGALHIHGVRNGRDHCSLARLTPADQGILQFFLRTFQGSVCVEIFNYEALSESLQLLAKWMDRP